MPTPTDLLFVLVLVVGAAIVEHRWFWPRFRREVAEGDPMARQRGYRRGMVAQWTFVAAALWIWNAHGRSAEALRLAVPADWRLAASVAVVVLMSGLVALQLTSIVRLSAAKRIAARPRLGELVFLLPHTRRELAWFVALSSTAGVCEELLYRGYLVWFFAAWIGTPAAFAVVVLLFGIGHVYQGRSGATRATLAGAVMTALVALTGWLIPVMIVHALVDAGSGIVGYLLLRDAGGTTERVTDARVAVAGGTTEGVTGADVTGADVTDDGRPVSASDAPSGIPARSSLPA